MTAPVGLPEAIGTRLPDAVSPRDAEQSAGGATVTPFVEHLEQIVEDANEAQQSAESQARDFADGRSNDVHGTMIGLAQADIQLRFVASVRNRVIEAYREIMRMGA